MAHANESEIEIRRRSIISETGKGYLACGAVGKVQTALYVLLSLKVTWADITRARGEPLLQLCKGPLEWAIDLGLMMILRKYHRDWRITLVFLRQSCTSVSVPALIFWPPFGIYSSVFALVYIFPSRYTN